MNCITIYFNRILLIFLIKKNNEKKNIILYFIENILLKKFTIQNCKFYKIQKNSPLKKLNRINRNYLYDLFMQDINASSI